MPVAHAYKGLRSDEVVTSANKNGRNVHVIFLEIIMAPTCSIVYENEEMESGLMSLPPRKLTTVFLSFRQLARSIVQGLIIAAGCLSLGYYYMQHSEETFVRTIIFITLLFCNIFLTLVDRSFYYSIITTIKYKNYLIPVIIVLTLLLILAALYVPFARALFDLHPLSLPHLAVCIACAVVSTYWIEIHKWIRRSKRTR